MCAHESFSCEHCSMSWQCHNVSIHSPVDEHLCYLQITGLVISGRGKCACFSIFSKQNIKEKNHFLVLLGVQDSVWKELKLFTPFPTALQFIESSFQEHLQPKPLFFHWKTSFLFSPFNSSSLTIESAMWIILKFPCLSLMSSQVGHTASCTTPGPVSLLSFRLWPCLLLYPSKPLSPVCLRASYICSAHMSQDSILIFMVALSSHLLHLESFNMSLTGSI